MSTKKQANSGKLNWPNGSIVECINDDFHNVPSMIRLIFQFPQAGERYTVRATIPDSIYLEEIRNPVVQWPASYNYSNCEPAFFKWRFKPILAQTIEVESIAICTETLEVQ